MVGAVVVKKGEILSKDYHKKFGGSHAEAIAIKACSDRAKGATLYTTLEPCCHFGKTPPCNDLIIHSGIKKVVCAAIDPNPQVNGKGIRSLRKEGIKVNLGVLEKEAKKLNEVYFKYVTTELPFVVLKVIQTLNGRVIHQAKSSEVKKGGIFSELIQSKNPWIDAVLYDPNATEADSIVTFLTSSNSAKPKVILFGTRQKIEGKLNKIRKDELKSIIFVPTDSENAKRKREGIFETWMVKKRRDGQIDFVSLLKKAVEEGITSLLVEGGTDVTTQFLKQKLVDKIWYFISPDIRGKGEEPFGDLGVRKISDAITLKNCEFKQSKNGLLAVGYPVEGGNCQ